MAQEQVFDYEIPIVFNGYSPVSSGLNPTRSYAWDIDMETDNRGFYGYGYGISFYDIEDVGAIDYFHVIGVTGTSTGYGILDTKGGEIDEFNFGWGYEFAPSVLSDNLDEISVTATVTENGNPVQNKRVVFVGSTGSSLSVNSGYTDENGQLETVVKMDNTVKNMRMLDDNDSKVKDYLLKSTIANTTMIGYHPSAGDTPDYQWLVYLPAGKDPSQFFLPEEETSELGSIRITVTDPNSEYITAKVKPSDLIYIDDEERWVLKFTSVYIYPVDTISDDERLAVPVTSTTLQIFTVSDGNKKYESLPINGWMNVRAYIDERPQVDEGEITINVSSNQNRHDDAVFDLIFDSYSFQTFRAYSFAE